jgi:hypothetical protein
MSNSSADRVRALRQAQMCQHNWKYIEGGGSDFRVCPLCRYVEQLCIYADGETPEIRKGEWLMLDCNVDVTEWLGSEDKQEQHRREGRASAGPRHPARPGGSQYGRLRADR